MTVLWAAILMFLPASNRVAAEGLIEPDSTKPGIYSGPNNIWVPIYEDPNYNNDHPLMTNLRTIIDDYLYYKNEIGLTSEQQYALKALRDKYQTEIIRLNADLNIELMDLHNLTMEEEVNMDSIQSAKQRAESLQIQIQNKNIDLFVSAQRLLTPDQLGKTNNMGIKPNPYKYYGYRKIMGF